ncbi:DNA polymerase delta small subunit, putative [Entamoeba invadens IP1]|uniref:DNA polymerase delta small subunit, putative n=1 Tax=Entamoeba invadens IP1 TaxID=370355 RepID=UPI0002C3E139|nr:DNA polymerase delta small subunit, putative [Entamoeba invadens IP1]ELP90382.1 DNA polymerase delta small subunit, putative [Entamoeba invadens IP1]|eukprot:XP_004257153.1 DNA polymerase delta small subunit, putative [Entamoeba invadens IP1]
MTKAVFGKQFETPKMDYSQQYSKIYSSRLTLLRPLLEVLIEKKYEGMSVQTRLTNIPSGETSLIGTIFKKSKKLPTVLAQHKKDPKHIKIDFTQPPFHADDDSAYLEDLIGHTDLVMKPEVLNTITSGTVIAVIGTINTEGFFNVTDVIFPYEEPIETTVMNCDATKNITVISDIRFSACKTDLMLYDVLKNKKIELGTDVFVIGNHYLESMGSPLVDEYDGFLSEVSKGIPVTVIPEGDDPTNAVLPFQPFHRAMFVKSMKNNTETQKSFNLVSNPSIVTLGDITIMFLSQEVFVRAMDLTILKTPQDVFCFFLKAGHLCPFAPSMFPCYPYEKDPFVLNEPFPDFFIVGGFEEMCYSVNFMGKTICLVTVPSFYKEKKFVVLNTDSHENVVVDLNF